MRVLTGGREVREPREEDSTSGHQQSAFDSTGSSSSSLVSGADLDRLAAAGVFTSPRGENHASFLDQGVMERPGRGLTVCEVRAREPKDC